MKQTEITESLIIKITDNKIIEGLVIIQVMRVNSNVCQMHHLVVLIRILKINLQIQLQIFSRFNLAMLVTAMFAKKPYSKT